MVSGQMARRWPRSIFADFLTFVSRSERSLGFRDPFGSMSLLRYFSNIALRVSGSGTAKSRTEGSVRNG